jgi:two-component system chemotaxis response regulator CheB
MAYRIVIVDDSSFFRRRIKKILEKDHELEVVGEAADGLEALSVIAELSPDVVTMDIEMPVMDGITAVRKLMASQPIPILMFSSLTTDGAQATLDALQAGAQDFIPKKFQDIALNRSAAVLELQNRVKFLAKSRALKCSFQKQVNLAKPQAQARENSQDSAAESSSLANNINKRGHLRSSIQNHSSFRCLAIGASTGGPVALQKILTELPKDFPLPVILVQHMPASFTEAFAKRLDDLCEVTVKLGAHGMLVRKGECYLAPGGKQMTVSGSKSMAKLVVSDPEVYPNVAYRPCVDVTFASLADLYGGNVLGVILTGMGSDGTKGCKLLKDLGAKIWAQDEDSSVVYGMPQAVTLANIAEENISIDRFSSRIINQITG